MLILKKIKDSNLESYFKTQLLNLGFYILHQYILSRCSNADFWSNL